MRGERHENLRRDGRYADDKRRNHESPSRARERDPKQTDDYGAEGRDHETPVLDHIAQGHQKQQPRAVAELSQSDDEAGKSRVQPQSGRDETDERLGVVDVGDRETTGDCEDRDPRWAEGAMRQLTASRRRRRGPGCALRN